MGGRVVKELLQKIKRKIVAFGRRILNRRTTSSMQQLEQLVKKHSESIQWFSDTLAAKSYLIDCNTDELRKQRAEFKKIQIQFKEAVEKTHSDEMRIFQIVPTLNAGDAIGNYTLYIRDTLADMGISADIYCYENLSGLPDIKTVDELPVTTEKDMIFLHMAAENDFVEVMEAYRAKKILFYHNITPSHFFHGFDEFAEGVTKRGRIQLDYLKRKVDACIADSEYNKSELRELGYGVPIYVVPIPFEKEDYSNIESVKVKEKLSDGKKNILFVGRIAPNKKMEDLIESYQMYYDNYDKNVRLILLGNYNASDKYYQYLQTKLRPEDDIVFTGKIKTEEWITYYKYADLFLCLSEHEGFCVPLIEAMSYQIPIIAYDSSAVGETLGDAGILLKSKNPEEVARTIHQIFNDKECVDEIRKKQQQRIHAFDSKLVAQKLNNVVTRIGEE